MDTRVGLEASASVSASRNFVSGFRGSMAVFIKRSFMNFVSIPNYLQAKARRITRCCLRWCSKI